MKPPRSNPRPQVLFRITILLLAGALTSIAVAWSIEIAAAYRTSTITYPTDWPAWSTPRGRSPTLVFQDPHAPNQSLWYEERTKLGRSIWIVSRADLAFSIPTRRTPPSWLLAPGPEAHSSASATAYGLPFRCMYLSSTCTGDSSTVNENAMTGSCSLHWHLTSNIFFDIKLPLRPILPNLLLNTLFYATLFSTPYLLRQTRRHLRLRRGHCPACNYNLLHDFTKPCPECGRNSALSPQHSALQSPP